MTAPAAKAVAKTWTGEDPPRLEISEDGNVLSCLNGERLLNLANGQTVGVLQSSERLLKVLGKPARLSPGLGGCATDPLEFWYYKVEEGVLIVTAFDKAYPSAQNNEIPVELRGKIARFWLSRREGDDR